MDYLHPKYRIFISYRWVDPALADKIHDYLVKEFDDTEVYRDISKPHIESLEELRDFVKSCDVLLIIMGHHWEDEYRKRHDRSDDEMDWVKEEVKIGIQTDGVFVIPVIVNGAPVPKFDFVDDDNFLKALKYKTAARLNEASFDEDIKDLIERVQKRYARWAGVTRFHPNFPHDQFLRWVRNSHSTIQVLYTYSTVVWSQRDAIKDAVQRGVKLQLLLIDPHSHAAKQREADLNDDISFGVRQSLYGAYKVQDAIEDKSLVEVRLYSSLPYLIYMRCDNRALVGFYPMGKMGNTSPHLEIYYLDRGMGEFAATQFAAVWDKAVPVDLSEYAHMQ